MADSKHLGAFLKKSGSEERKSKRHKRQKSGITDSSESCQEKQIVASESTETPEDLEKGSEDVQSQDSASNKAKKKSLLRKLSFGKKKKKDVSDVTDGDTGSAVESGAAVGDKTDEEKFAGTSETEATAEENSDILSQQEENKSPISPESDATKAKHSSPLPSEETEESQEIDFESQAKDSSNGTVEIKITKTADDDEVNSQVEIPPNTDIAEGVPQTIKAFSEIDPEKLKSKENEVSNENSFVDTIYVILRHMKELPFGSDRYGHVSEITSETCRLIITAADKSFSRFESLFNFLLNQAGEKTRKIVMYFLAGLIKRYPQCFKVRQVKKKTKKSALKSSSSKAGTKSCQRDTVC